MEHVEVDGLRIAFERAGSGQPLLLLHGFLGDHREWRRQIEGLSDEFTVLAWDAPGSGRSSDPPESFRLPDYADCVAGFLAELGVERPHVAGLSFGGALALQVAGRHPSVPRSLVLAGAYAGWAGSLPPEEVTERLRISLAVADLPPERLASVMLPTLFPDGTEAEVVEEYTGILAGLHPDGFRAMARSSAEADLRDQLGRIEVPTLLMSGDRDARAPLPVAEALRAAISGAELVVMQGVGHMMHMQAGDRFNSEVRTFLRAVQV